MDNLKKQFGKIYDKNVDAVYRFVFFKVNSEEIAQDLTSEAFLKGWEAFQKEGNNIENPRAFIYRIARNLVIDYYRRKDRTQIIPVEDLWVTDPGPSLEEKVLLNSDFEKVKTALNGLKDNYQNVIIMRYIEGMSTKEISKITRKSDGAVRVLLHRALESLRQEIKTEVREA